MADKITWQGTQAFSTVFNEKTRRKFFISTVCRNGAWETRVIKDNGFFLFNILGWWKPLTILTASDRAEAEKLHLTAVSFIQTPELFFDKKNTDSMEEYGLNVVGLMALLAFLANLESKKKKIAESR